MTFILLLAACASPVLPDSGSTDTAPDTGDTAADCRLDSVDPASVAVSPSDADGSDVTVSGCAEAVIVTCPDWITLTGPSSVDGEAVFHAAFVPGWSGDRDGECTINEVSVVVALRM